MGYDPILFMIITKFPETQSHSSFLVHAKWQSVLRTCLTRFEERWKDPLADDPLADRPFMKHHVEEDAVTLMWNLKMNLTSFSGVDFNAVTKLKYATCKVWPDSGVAD